MNYGDIFRNHKIMDYSQKKAKSRELFRKLKTPVTDQLKLHNALILFEPVQMVKPKSTLSSGKQTSRKSYMSCKPSGQWKLADKCKFERR